MNKHIENALNSYGFSFEKNSGYGFINDYEVNVVVQLGMGAPTFTFSTYLSLEKKNQFVFQLNQRKLRFVRANAFDFGVSVTVGALTTGQFEKKIADTIPVIIEILESLGAPKKDFCPHTGEKLDEQDSRLVDLCGAKIRISNKGIDAVNTDVAQSNEEFKNAPNNYLKGFSGILVGALAGVAVTVIAALAGFITAFASIVSVCLGVYLYKKFGGKQNYVMIVMSLVTTLVVILGAVVLLYMSAANVIVKEAGLTMNSGFEALKYCINNEADFKKELTIDLALNGLFILIGEGYSIFGLIKMIRRPKGIQ